ncbi:glycosytransferase [Pseudomonas sp. Pc102]|uniref:glycosyltransferase n=1 Tax=Pseudomonas sp. Pc102 TaxID=2678261 RepID=UPI001BCA74BC|nr:glycosyltransferase [Pseudomonas sp. Pc102]BBP86044.1 glycosytransferase [Pseudomonas sp. Pc102]
MSHEKPLRAMWLLNHSTLRQFEIRQLSSLGIEELYLPKSFPYDEGNLSASVTYEHDDQIDLSPEEIELLNGQNWYEEPSEEAWAVANRHFDIAFIGFFPQQMLSACRNFRGAIVVRAFGLGGEETYSKLIRQIGKEPLQSAIHRCGKRFWFGMGYEHLADIEEPYIEERSLHMPVGLNNATVTDRWEGNERLVFFVCPRIGSSPYFNRIYSDFKYLMGELPYRVGGAQPIHVNDKDVLGYVSNEQHAYNMTQSRVMFYHSQEPNHIHYHPFEAIRNGMPLVFMAGGMLDKMGGINLPGRCKTLAEAKRKLKQILSDDWSLIEKIRASQAVLLNPMEARNCEPIWRESFSTITDELAQWRADNASRPAVARTKRIAVILPVAYRGGSLRGAIALARALHLGSRQCGEDADVVFFHLDNPKEYPESEFNDLPSSITRRPFNWKYLSGAEAKRAMRYADYAGWEPSSPHYMVPDDGIRQAMDCDLWLVVSDRLSHPLLPLKPTTLMVYDYLQRYEDLLSHGADQPFLASARSAEKVLVTTEFTRQDALQYAGLDPRRVNKVPMLAPEFPIERFSSNIASGGYFIWTTNAAPHKNHTHAAEALQIYYEELDGSLECRVTGVNTKKLLASELPHLKAMAEVFSRSKKLRKRVKWLGELPDTQYRRTLTRAAFLWHAGRIDNGTFAVIEAACFGIPALSSDYPAMREIDAQFSLSLAWMNSNDPRQMAEQLKVMEEEAESRRTLLPNEEQLIAQRLDAHAKAYWQEIRACL